MKRLNFTDNTFIILLEPNEGNWYYDTPYLESGVPLALSLPNSVVCLDKTTGAINDGVYRKTDQYGGAWTFTVNSNLSKIEYGTTVILSYAGYISALLSIDNSNRIGIARVFNTYTPSITNNNYFVNAGTTNFHINTAFCYKGVGINGSTFNETSSLMRANADQYNDGVSGTINFKANNLISNAVLNFYSKNTNARLGATYPICYPASPSGVTTNTATIGGSGETFNPIAPSIDPYEGGGSSTTGGGDGTFDGSSDAVDIPSLPTVGATDAGFITLFAPTETQLKSLAEYMWSSAFDIEGGGTAIAFKKLFNDPMDCILGLSVVPVSVPTSGAREITVGNIVTTVQMNVASQQYIEVDCGSISFTDKYFGSYLDYEPYTKMAIFVPYSGVHTISADDIMGKTVTLKYHIDILTGSLVAFLKCGNSVLYEFNGACASNIPVNSLNYASTIENAIRIAVNIGTTVATAGAAAPATGGLTGKAIAQGVALAGSTAEGAISMKPSIDRAGSLGGTTGLMGNQIPYIIITRPRLCRPTNQNKIKGYPSFIEITLNELNKQGYTEFDSIILDGLYLTDAEKQELENILMGGVYL